MTALRLNRKLVLEAPQTLPDGAGGYTRAWTPLGTLWAEVAARSGRETAAADMPVGLVVYRITVRAAPQGSTSRPQAGQRFVEDARVYTIGAVAERGSDGRYLVCYAEEEVAP